MLKPCTYSLLFAFFLLTSARAAESDAWELTSKTEDFTLYRKPSVGSADLVAFRGIGILANSPLEVATAILDRTRRPQWMRDIRELRLVRMIGPGHLVEYSWVKTPFVIKDRDFLVQTDVEVDASRGTVVIVSRSVKDDAVPPTSAVRGELTDGRFVLEPGPTPGTTKLTADMDVDPKGSVPRWIVNHFQKNWPIGMFQGLKRFLARKVATLPEDLHPVLAPLTTPIRIASPPR